MYWEQRVQFAGLSDIGFRRSNNQDSYAVQICENRETWVERGHLFLVADGMGGHAVGELASKIAADTMPHTFFKVQLGGTAAALKNAIEAANAVVHERGTLNQEFDQMGTTCSALVLSPHGAYVGQVGDSRVYRIRGGEIHQLSFDHSLQWELIRNGMNPADVYASQPSNVITRSLGPEKNVDVDIEGPLPTQPNDVYVLCSDGLTGHVQDHEIGMIASLLPPGEACRMLVNLANLRGGSDNITVIVCKIDSIPDGVTPQPVPELETPSEPDTPLTWGWLVGGWIIAALFVAGVALALLKSELVGSVLAGLSVLAGVGLLMMYLKREKPPVPVAVRGHVGDPYRIAPAAYSRDFAELLINIKKELHSVGHQEHWPIDWAEYEQHARAAEKADSENQPRKSFRHHCKAFSVLMKGVSQHKKRLDHAAKWKKTAEPSVPHKRPSE